MHRTVLSSDWHLGHPTAPNWRPQFSSLAEHDNFIFNNAVEFIRPTDTLMLLGDIVFTRYWLERIAEIRCAKKILIPGNHCTERGLHMRDYVEVFDEIHSLYAFRNYWFSHAPIHSQELRGRIANIHGHQHDREITGEDSHRYLNVSIEQTDYRPITFADAVARIKERSTIKQEQTAD